MHPTWEQIHARLVKDDERVVDAITAASGGARPVRKKKPVNPPMRSLSLAGGGGSGGVGLFAHLLIDDTFTHKPSPGAAHARRFQS
jgi:hypothetical protein